MADPVLREPVPPLPYHVEEEQELLGLGARQDLSSRLQRRWEEWKDRIGHLRTAYGSSFARELRNNAEDVRSRVRYYHERRPLHVLGTIAAATFAAGLLVGLRRR